MSFDNEGRGVYALTITLDESDFTRLDELRKGAGLGSFIIPDGTQLNSDGWVMAKLMNKILGISLDEIFLLKGVDHADRRTT